MGRKSRIYVQEEYIIISLSPSPSLCLLSSLCFVRSVSGKRGTENLENKQIQNDEGTMVKVF